MFAPVAPLFASECWSKFLTVPNRVDANEKHLKWSKDVLQQNWPKSDDNIDDIVVIKVSHFHELRLLHGILIENLLFLLDKWFKNNSTTNRRLPERNNSRISHGKSANV